MSLRGISIILFKQPRYFLLAVMFVCALLATTGWLMVNSFAQTSESEQLRGTPPAVHVIARALAPTKFARLIPSVTPQPSSTATYTLAPTATRAPNTATAKPRATPTSTREPSVRPNTLAPTPTSTDEPTVQPNTPTQNSMLAAHAITDMNSCAPIPGETYGTLPIVSAPTDRPAELHPDLNLALRGYARTDGQLGIMDISGATDAVSVQLVGLFADRRTPIFKNLYRVYDWNWSANARGDLIAYPDATMAGFAVNAGETIHVPDAGANIGLGNAVLVLYASATRITLKYTGEDNVQRGYTLHLEGICVEPRLLALYQQQNNAGRGELPALRAGQALGRASGDELGVAIRDDGSFMDPRSRKDWWRGR